VGERGPPYARRRPISVSQRFRATAAVEIFGDDNDELAMALTVVGSDFPTDRGSGACNWLSVLAALARNALVI